MDITLSEADQRRLAACLETLLSPLSYPDVDGWRASVNGRMKELFDLDCALFALAPTNGRDLIFSTDRSRDVLRAYESFFEEDSGNRRAEAFGLTVLNLETLVAGDWDAFYADPFVNEYWIPNGTVDHLGIRLLEPNGRIAQFELHRDRLDPERCGDRALAVMRLLLPAFRAGVGAAFRLFEHKETLSRVLDSLGEPLMACDERGQAVHQNAALQGLLARDPHGSRLTEEMSQVGWQMAALRDPRVRTRRSRDPTAAAVRETRTPLGTYRIRGTYVPSELLGPAVCCLIALEAPRNASRVTLTAEQVAERFGLTAQQAKVALLLAARRSNEEVARALGISPHTARRHTEQVLQKLGVHSRKDVERALNGPDPSRKC